MYSDRKKVLILTYYWPPYGDVGSHRWAKFAKHLRDFGWEPVVFTARQNEFPIVDKSLENDLPNDIEVIKVPIWEPYVLYRQLLGIERSSHSGFLTHKKSDSLLNTLALWIRGNLFVPDARIFWVRPATKFLRQWLATNKVAAIVSTGTPHSTHLIARKLKQSTGIPWLADFRDLWTKINYYDKIRPISGIHARNERMEQAVLDAADQITTVSTSWSQELQKSTMTPVSVVHNGYDIEDFGTSNIESDHLFRICHAGYLTQERNCQIFWKALSDLCSTNKIFREVCRIELYGVVDEGILKDLKDLGLANNLLIHGYLEHAQLVPLLRKKNVLMLSIGRGDRYTQGWIPAKLYEYLAAGRPIISFGKAGSDCDQILTESNHLPVIGYEDEKNTKSTILKLFNNFHDKKEHTVNTNTSRFERKELTKKVCHILNDMVEIKSDENE